MNIEKRILKNEKYKKKKPLDCDFFFLARPTRFERAAYRVGVCRSIQLGYGRMRKTYYNTSFCLPQ